MYFYTWLYAFCNEGNLILNSSTIHLSRIHSSDILCITCQNKVTNLWLFCWDESCLVQNKLLWSKLLPCHSRSSTEEAIVDFFAISKPKKSDYDVCICVLQKIHVLNSKFLICRKNGSTWDSVYLRMHFLTYKNYTKTSWTKS